MNRRKFLSDSGQVLAGAVLLPPFAVAAKNNQLFFDISVAQWSLHRQLRRGALKVLDFPAKVKKDFDIEAVEYVNQFFKDKARDKPFLRALKGRADDAGVKSLLIMIDGEGALGSLNDKQRLAAVEQHYPWVEAAAFLGCHSIRVNAAGEGDGKAVQKAAIDGLSRLSTFARDYQLNIIVENHGGYSSNGKWLAEVIKRVDQPNCGTLPDFGNFNGYDRYLGVEELMPYAKGVSAKSFEFDGEGNEIQTDFEKMLRIIKAANFRGHIGIEYEGKDDDEDKGIIATKALLLRLGRKLSV